MKTQEKESSAQAENMETMELLTGMLDNATHCGRETQDKEEKSPASTAEPKAPATAGTREKAHE